MPILKPTLIVIAGPNGSGKTSVTAQILKHEMVDGCIKNTIWKFLNTLDFQI